MAQFSTLVLGLYVALIYFFEYVYAAPDYSAGTGVGLVVLDDCNFHESVRLDDFESERALTLVSPILTLPLHFLFLG